MSSALTRRGVLSLAAASALGLAGCAAQAPAADSAAPATTHRSSASTPTPTPTPTPTFDSTAHSISAPDSLWVVVDKQRPLPSTFVPSVVPVPVAHTNPPLLRGAAAAAVVQLFAAARKDGLLLASNSTYRSYADQREVYDSDLADLGRAKADLLTAHPGCSEHQTGLAIDIGAESGRCTLDTCLGAMPEGRWLAANAWRFGFLLRYPKDKVAVTGFQYEPWHFRYLGTDLAHHLHRIGVQTLEEFFGLPAAPVYT